MSSDEVVMFSICSCGWRLRFWLRLRTTSTLKLTDGTAVGAGVGVGAEMEAGMGDGAATTQTSRITAGPPQNPGLGPKRRFEALEAIPAFTFGGFWGHVSKMEKWTFAPGTPPYNSNYYPGILSKICVSRNPRVRFRVGTPPFSSISFLLTAHARNAPPSTVEAVRLWWRGLGG